MPTTYPDLFGALAAAFDPQEIRVRTQAGRQLQYITARTAMNRLDDVVGPESWWDDYVPGENSVLCRLTIRLPDGSTLTKADAGGYAGMPDQGDDDKSGFSDAFKRAAVKFGVGRYLYRDGVPSFARERPPAPAAVEGRQAPVVASRPAPGQNPPAEAPGPRHGAARPPGSGDGGGGSAPRSGRALFAWVKDEEKRSGEGLLKYANTWAKLQDFPGRMVDWDGAQVALAHAELVRRIKAARTVDAA